MDPFFANPSKSRLFELWEYSRCGMSKNGHFGVIFDPIFWSFLALFDPFFSESWEFSRVKCQKMDFCSKKCFKNDPFLDPTLTLTLYIKRGPKMDHFWVQKCQNDPFWTLFGPVLSSGDEGFFPAGALKGGQK